MWIEELFCAVRNSLWLVMPYILVGEVKTVSYSQYAGQVTSLTGWYERPQRKCREKTCHTLKSKTHLKIPP